uniref:ATP synthase CF1 delta subunit n=1 Tax=Cyanophora sudae TaxID=1522369 RepID=A0A2Z4HFW0_9EUKA|nr:ATP synthase CF1 delta subunit [Cyanophora sudae]AWW13659.1 ATP synthase CF1 delta subunit [Cyanophora sudae]
MKQSAVVSKIVQPYAEALLEMAQKHDIVETINNDITLILNYLQNSTKLQQFLANPLVKKSAKKDFFEKILGKEIHQYTFKFLMLVIDRGRISCLEIIAQKYQSLILKLTKTELAEVVTAVPLSSEQEATLNNIVKELTNANEVKLVFKIDQNLIGGFIINIGSKVVDASLLGQLLRIGNYLGLETV